MKIYWDKKYLEEQLLAGKNYLDIAKENRIGKSTVQRALKHYKLTNSSQNWSMEEIQLLKKHYGKNTNYGLYFPQRTASSIYHKTNRLGLKNHIKFRKYSLNEQFFQKWTKKMAYVLGWLYSDGNLCSTMRSIRLKISIKDIDILHKINGVIKSNAPIKISEQHVPSRKYIGKYSQLRINSRKMCQDLIHLGCVPNKTKKSRVPNMPNYCLSHFFRGYFDGDGSISFNYPNTIRICFVGSNAVFIKQLASIINRALGIPINFKKIRKFLWACHYYGDNARTICYWMYSNCGDLFLSRKRKRFIQHLHKRGNNRGFHV